MTRERNVAVALSLLPVVLAAYLVLMSETSPWWVVGAAAVGGALTVSLLRRGRHTPWATARERVAPGHAVVFWKPGCRFCTALMRQMGDDERVTWVNVWVDREANAEVRLHNNGDELTPTALVDAVALRNPGADELRAVLRQE